MSRAPAVLALAAALVLPASAAAAPTAVFGKCARPAPRPTREVRNGRRPARPLEPGGRDDPDRVPVHARTRDRAPAVSAIVISNGGPGSLEHRLRPAVAGTARPGAQGPRPAGHRPSRDRRVGGDRLPGAPARAGQPARRGARVRREPRRRLRPLRLRRRGRRHRRRPRRARHRQDRLLRRLLRRRRRARVRVPASPTTCARRCSTRRTSPPTTRSSARCRARWRRSPCACASARPPAGRRDSTRPRRWRRSSSGVRSHPVSGTGYDASGTAHKLKVDEVGLLNILYDDYFADPAFLNQGEIFAAAHALNARRQDAAAAAGRGEQRARRFRAAARLAVGRRRLRRVLRRQRLPVGQVRARGDAPHAVRGRRQGGVPASATAPFTVAAWTGFIASQPVLLIPGADACTPWPAPARPEPPFPAEQPFPANVPALLMGGGLDYLDVAAERTLLPLFPAGHAVRDDRQRRSRDLAVEPLRGRHRRPLPRRRCRPATPRAPRTRRAQTGMPFGARAGQAADPGRARASRAAKATKRRVAARGVGRRGGRRLPVVAARGQRRAAGCAAGRSRSSSARPRRRSRSGVRASRTTCRCPGRWCSRRLRPGCRGRSPCPTASSP